MKLFDFLNIPVVKQRFLFMINLSSHVAALETAKIVASSSFFLGEVKALEHLLPRRINVLVQIALLVKVVDFSKSGSIKFIN